jgi:xylobiose transport system substrate-binding protein
MTDHGFFEERLARTLTEAGEALPHEPAGAYDDIRRRLARQQRRERVARAAAAVLIAVAVVVTGFAPHLPAHLPGTGPATLDMWAAASDTVPGLHRSIDGFEQDTGDRIRLSTYDDETYRKLADSMLAGGATPEIFESRGGANLAGVARLGAAADLTDDLATHPEVTGRILGNVLAAGQVDGRQYGLPMTGVRPIMLFYNKRLFTDAGLSPPRTFADLLTAVDTFRSRKITPIAMAGASGWTVLMYLAYLTDRLGGPGVFADIVAGRPGAWRHPAVLRAAEMIQQLVRRGAFDQDAAGVYYDSGVATRQLADGRAAMELMVSGEYGAELATNPAFAATGLGWMPFPAVSGGTGDPANVVGVPANYLAVKPHSGDAAEFLLRTVTSRTYVEGLLDAGETPPIRDLEPYLAGRPNADFVRFTHRLTADAPTFTLVWDRALATAAATALCDKIPLLFQLALTPGEFTTAMDAAS